MSYGKADDGGEARVTFEFWIHFRVCSPVDAFQRMIERSSPPETSHLPSRLNARVEIDEECPDCNISSRRCASAGITTSRGAEASTTIGAAAGV